METKLLHERVFKRIELKLKQQKLEGKKLISDDEVDNLIDEIINEEINKPISFTTGLNYPPHNQ